MYLGCTMDMTGVGGVGGGNEGWEVVGDAYYIVAIFLIFDIHMITHLIVSWTKVPYTYSEKV